MKHYLIHCLLRSAAATNSLKLEQGRLHSKLSIVTLYISSELLQHKVFNGYHLYHHIMLYILFFISKHT